MKFRIKRQGYSRCGSDSGISCDGTKSPDIVEEAPVDSMGTSSSQVEVEENSSKNSPGEFDSIPNSSSRKYQNTSKPSTMDSSSVLSLTKNMKDIRVEKVQSSSEDEKVNSKCFLNDTEEWNKYVFGRKNKVCEKDFVTRKSYSTSEIIKSKSKYAGKSLNTIENIFARKRKVSDTSSSSEYNADVDQQLFKMPKRRSKFSYSTEKNIFTDTDSDIREFHQTPNLEIPKTNTRQDKKSSVGKNKRFSVENFILKEKKEDIIGKKIRKRSRILRISESESDSSKSNENLTNYVDSDEETSKKISPKKKTKSKSIDSEEETVKNIPPIKKIVNEYLEEVSIDQKEDTEKNKPKNKHITKRSTDCTNINNNLDVSSLEVNVVINDKNTNLPEFNTIIDENETEKEEILKSVSLNRKSVNEKSEKKLKFDGYKKKHLKRRIRTFRKKLSGLVSTSDSSQENLENIKEKIQNVQQLEAKKLILYEKKFNTKFLNVFVTLDRDFVSNWLKNNTKNNANNQCQSPTKDCRIVLERMSVSPEKPKKCLILNRNWNEFEIVSRPKPKFCWHYKDNVNVVTSKNDIFKEARLSEGFQSQIEIFKFNSDVNCDNSNESKEIVKIAKNKEKTNSNEQKKIQRTTINIVKENFVNSKNILETSTALTVKPKNSFKIREKYSEPPEIVAASDSKANTNRTLNIQLNSESENSTVESKKSFKNMEKVRTISESKEFITFANNKEKTSKNEYKKIQKTPNIEQNILEISSVNNKDPKKSIKIDQLIIKPTPNPSENIKSLPKITKKTKTENKSASSHINRLTTETRIQIKTPERINEESKDKKQCKRLSVDKTDHRKDSRRSLSKEKHIKISGIENLPTPDDKNNKKDDSRSCKVLETRFQSIYDDLDEDLNEYIQENSIETTQSFMTDINLLSQYCDTPTEYREIDYRYISDDDHIDIVEEKFNWSPEEIENSEQTIAELLPESKLDILQKNKDTINTEHSIEKNTEQYEQKTFEENKNKENKHKKIEKQHDDSKNKKHHTHKKSSISHEHKSKTHKETHNNAKHHEKVIDKQVKSNEISQNINIKSCETNKIQESRPKHKTDHSKWRNKEIKNSEAAQGNKDKNIEKESTTNLSEEISKSTTDNTSELHPKESAREVQQISDSLNNFHKLKITINNTQRPLTSIQTSQNSDTDSTKTTINNTQPPLTTTQKPSETPPKAQQDSNTDSNEPHTPESHPKTPDIVFPKPKTFKFEKNEVKRPPTRPKKVILKRPVLSVPSISSQYTFKVPVSPVCQSVKSAASQSVKLNSINLKNDIPSPKKQDKEFDTISIYAETIGVESLADMSVKNDSDSEEDFNMLNFIPELDPVKQSNMNEWVENTVKVCEETENVPEIIKPEVVKNENKICYSIFDYYCNNKLTFGSCRKIKCKFDHELRAGWEKEILELSVEKLMNVYRYYRHFENLLKKIFPVITARLGELRDFNNLISMVKDVLELKMNTDRAPFINDIISALCKTGVTFHSIVEVVYKNANVNKNLRDLLSDILLNLTVDKGDSYNNWPIIKELIFSKNYDIDLGMIKSIIIECLEKEPNNKDLYYKIYHDMLNNISDTKLASIFESVLNNFYIRLQKYNYNSEANEFNTRCQKLNIILGIKSDHASPKTPSSTLSTPKSKKININSAKTIASPPLLPKNFVPYQNAPKITAVQQNISPVPSVQPKCTPQSNLAQNPKKPIIQNISPGPSAPPNFVQPNFSQPPTNFTSTPPNFPLLPNFSQPPPNFPKTIPVQPNIATQSNFPQQPVQNFTPNYYQNRRGNYNNNFVKPKVNYNQGWYPPQKRNLSNKKEVGPSKVVFSTFEVNDAMYSEDIPKILSLILKYKDNEHTDLFIKTSFDALLESSHNYPTFVGKLFETARIPVVNTLNDKASMYILKTLGLNIVLYLIQANNWEHAYNVYLIIKNYITDDLFNVKLFIKDNPSYFKRMLIIARMLIKKLEIENSWEMIRDYNFQINGVWHGDEDDLFYLKTVLEELLLTLKNNPNRIIRNKPWEVGMEMMQYVLKHRIEFDINKYTNQIFLFALNHNCELNFMINFVNSTPNWCTYINNTIFRAIIVHAVRSNFNWGKKLFLTAMNCEVYPMLFGNDRSVTIRTDYVFEEVHLIFDVLFEKMIFYFPIQHDINIHIKELEVKYISDDPAILRQYKINADSAQARIANILNNFIQPAVTIVKKNKILVLNTSVVNNHLEERMRLNT